VAKMDDDVAHRVAVLFLLSTNPTQLALTKIRAFHDAEFLNLFSAKDFLIQ
jgi:hypothetical protein